MRLKLICLVLILVVSLPPVGAQRVIGGCGPGDPRPTPTPIPTPTPTPTPPACPTSIGPGGSVMAPWGFYFWQVDLRNSTATFSTELDFSSNPGGLVRIPIPASGTLPCNITVHKIHGTAVLEIQQGGSCNYTDVVAQVTDQNGNALASANLAKFGPSHVNIPIKASFSNPLTVSSFALMVNLNPGCSGVLSWQLVMT